MLPRQNRLKHMKDFDILYKEGRFVTDVLVTAKVMKIDPNKFPTRNYTQDDLLIGFVVSKKIEKSAVKRNRVKRQMREAVRLLLKEDKIKKGYIIALMAKKDIFGKSYFDIEKSVRSVFVKTGIV